MEKNRITSEEINTLPLKAWKGETVIISKSSKLSGVVNEIMKHPIVAFDTESKPAFRKGEYNPVALLQVAIPDKVFLIRICETGFTKELAQIFSSKKITKVGVAINDDIKELRKFLEFQPSGIIDLANLANEKGIINNGVRGLTALLLGFRISKRQQTSNWENRVLSQPQIDYAATDAWVCLGIYHQLMKIPDLS